MPRQAEPSRFCWHRGLSAAVGGDGHFALAFARLENHFFVHACWMEDDQLLRDAGRMKGIPARDRSRSIRHAVPCQKRLSPPQGLAGCVLTHRRGCGSRRHGTWHAGPAYSLNGSVCEVSSDANVRLAPDQEGRRKLRQGASRKRLWAIAATSRS